eukprot:gene10968-3040_t
MPRCTNCGAIVAQLVRRYGTALKLTECVYLFQEMCSSSCPQIHCKQTADPFLERDVVFLWFQVMMFDMHVFRHLLYNHRQRCDALASLGWKQLIRMHIFVLLLGTAYLHRRTVSGTAAILIQHLSNPSPFPEYHDLMLPFLWAMFAHAFGYLYMHIVLSLAHNGCLQKVLFKSSTMSSDETRMFVCIPSIESMFSFQLSQLWHPAMAVVCLFTETMNPSFPPQFYSWMAYSLQLILSWIIFQIYIGNSAYVSVSFATGLVGIILVVQRCLSPEIFAMWMIPNYHSL